MSDKRHFTVVEGNKEHGLFVGRNPSSVARKVVSKLSKGGKKVVFQLREITQGSKKKVYGPYEGMKKKLKEPRKVGDRVYKYESDVKKVVKKGGFGTGSQTIVEISLPKLPRTPDKYIQISKSGKIGFFGESKFSATIYIDRQAQNTISEAKLEEFYNFLIENLGYYELVEINAILSKQNRNQKNEIWKKLTEKLKSYLASYRKSNMEREVNEIIYHIRQGEGIENHDIISVIRKYKGLIPNKQLQILKRQLVNMGSNSNYSNNNNI